VLILPLGPVSNPLFCIKPFDSQEPLFSFSDEKEHHSPSSTRLFQALLTSEMHFSAVALVSALVAVSVSAQTTHSVLVGENGLTFTPNQVTAAIGDTVSFEFHPKNHTLTQSTFASPCTAMSGGVNSGFMPVAANATTFPVYSLQINQVTPLWFFCEQTGHCQQGMVLAINVNASSPNSFDAFLAKATGNSTTASASGSAAPSGMMTSMVASGTGASTASTTAKASSASKVVGGSASALLAVAGLIAGLTL